MAETVDIGGKPIKLGAPGKISVCLDIVQAQSTNHRRAAFAALGACWQSPGAVRKVVYRHDALAYGGDVEEALLAAGFQWNPLFDAATVAFDLVRAKADAIDWGAVEEGKDSTPANGGTST